MDKSLNILLMVLFGILGMAVLLLTWLWTIPESEKVLATLLGSAGLLMALIRALMLKSSPVREDGQSLVTVEVEDKS